MGRGLGVVLSGRLHFTDITNRLFDPLEASGVAHLLFAAGIYLP